MCSKRNSKWFPLISIGLLLVVAPQFIKTLSAFQIPDIYKGFMMGSGISLELLALFLIRKERIAQNH